MEFIWDYIRENPWTWFVIGADALVWIAAVIVIFASPKFLRKWLWVLLSFFQFSYLWSISPDTMVGIEFPVGALYILWFWHFGRPPTQGEIAKAQIRRGKNTGLSRSVIVLRAMYIAATIATFVIGWLIISGKAYEVAFEGASRASHAANGTQFVIPHAFIVGEDCLAVALILLMAFLTLRPYWWGKIICLFAGLSWTGFAATSYSLLGKVSPEVFAVLACGLTLILACIVHQSIDPRFGGSYFRATKG